MTTRHPPDIPGTDRAEYERPRVEVLGSVLEVTLGANRGSTPDLSLTINSKTGNG